MFLFGEFYHLFGHPFLFWNFSLRLFEHLNNYKDYSKILLKNNLLNLIQDEFDKYFLIGTNTKEEKYNKMYIAGGLYNIYKYWLMNGCIESPKELSNMFFNLISQN